MAHWAVLVPADRWATERLFHHDTVTVTGAAQARPSAGDEVVVAVATTPPRVVALGRVGGVPDAATPDAVPVTYTRRAFDRPLSADGLALTGPLTPLDARVYERFADRLSGGDRRTWLVSLDLPIEADTPAEAVRHFWSYVTQLGPAELPTYVSPADDELAMQAFVLGEPANQDPEEDGDD